MGLVLRVVPRLVCVAALAVLGALGATACGSDDGASKGTPVDQCKAVIEAYCSRRADCIVTLKCDGDVPRAIEHDQCAAAFATSLDCSKAVNVTASYDTCLSKMKAFTCSQFGTSAGCLAPKTPDECAGVILLSQ